MNAMLIATVGGIAATFAMTAGAGTSAEPLRSLGAIVRLSDEELAAERPAVVRGVVTLANPHVVIDDGEAAIFVARRLPSGEFGLTCPP